MCGGKLDKNSEGSCTGNGKVDFNVSGARKLRFGDLFSLISCFSLLFVVIVRCGHPTSRVCLMIISNFKVARLLRE